MDIKSAHFCCSSTRKWNLILKCSVRRRYTSKREGKCNIASSRAKWGISLDLIEAHRTLGHIAFDAIRLMVKSGSFTGMEIDISTHRFPKSTKPRDPVLSVKSSPATYGDLRKRQQKADTPTSRPSLTTILECRWYSCRKIRQKPS